MANQKPLKEFSENAERTAEQTMAQAQGTMENYFGWLQKTISASPLSATEFGKKMQGYTEKNIAATQGYVQKLGQAKAFQDVVRIQTEYMQTQMSSFATQVKDLGESYSEALASAVKMPFDNAS